MLKKLLKYDFRSLFKLWKIFAIIVFAVLTSVGITLSFVIGPDEPNAVLIVFLAFLVMGAIFGVGAFAVSPLILSAVRFYKNLFSDEGYLTFTLPVKKKDIINSKIISSSIISMLSYIVIFLSVCSLIFFATMKDVAELLELLESIANFFTASGAWSFILILEILAGLFVISVFSIMLIFLCITIACIITKKARIITAIGIYYGVNSVIGFLQNILYFSTSGLISNLFSLPAKVLAPNLCLILLVLILFVSIFCIMLYILEYYFLDKKLNLA